MSAQAGSQQEQQDHQVAQHLQVCTAAGAQGCQAWRQVPCQHNPSPAPQTHRDPCGRHSCAQPADALATQAAVAPHQHLSGPLTSVCLQAVEPVFEGSLQRRVCELEAPLQGRNGDTLIYARVASTTATARQAGSSDGPEASTHAVRLQPTTFTSSKQLCSRQRKLWQELGASLPCAAPGGLQQGPFASPCCQLNPTALLPLQGTQRPRSYRLQGGPRSTCSQKCHGPRCC
jgi:hypothetical protein